MKVSLLFASLLLLLLAHDVLARTSASSTFGVASRPQALIHDETISSLAANKPSKSEKEYVLSQVLSSKGGFLAQHKDALAGAVIMALLERAINKAFVANSIKFPAQLAGCIGLFVFLVLADTVSSGLGETIYSKLLPGSALLAKWFPVLFVPGLVTLPLAPSIGNGVEVAKFLGVAVIGLLYSMSTTAYSVLFMRAAQGKLVKAAPVKAVSKKRKGAKAGPAPKPYRDETMELLVKITIVTGILSIFTTNFAGDSALETPLRTAFLFFTTFATFVYGARLPASITKIVHPLIISTILTLGVIYVTSAATGSDFIATLKTYKVGTFDVRKCGAADIMLFLLGPSVVSFAISMYSRRQLLKENLLIVVAAMLVSSVGGLFGTAFFVRLIRLGGSTGGLMVRLSTLSRNVTTALAMACTAILGGDVSLGVLIVVITGVLGATYGRTLLDAMGIYDPVTRGLAVGGAAQGLGVTSMMSEADAYPFAAMSMILTAISATVLVSIPAVKDTLVKICQG